MTRHIQPGELLLREKKHRQVSNWEPPKFCAFGVFPIILVSRGPSRHNGPGVFVDILDVNDLRMYLCPLMKMTPEVFQCSHHIEILGATCIWHVGMHSLLGSTCKIKIACRRKVFASSLKQLTGTG